MINRILDEIKNINKNNIIIAIDGRCASGKSSLAEELNKAIGVNVIHTDDFFLRPEQRTAERYAEPGGNMDRERFLSEVLLPLSQGIEFSYQPFDCKTMSLKEAVSVTPAKVTVIEGTYSCHPELTGYYDLRIFMTTAKDKQRDRITKRNALNAATFFEKWIPLEERYFDTFKTESLCNITFET